MVFQIDAAEMRRTCLLYTSLPSAGEQLSYSSSPVVITYFINMLGVEALATRTYCVNIIMFAYLFSISMACLLYTSPHRRLWRQPLLHPRENL